jgi:hypothetical protein
MSLGNPLQVPPLDEEEARVIDFKDRWFSEYNIYRVRRLEQMALNHHYLLGRQWIELDTEILLEGTRGFQFRQISSEDQHDIPRPVTNIIAPSVEVEISALGKRKLIPKVIPLSRDPRVEAATKIANDVLEDRLKKNEWPIKRSEVTLSTVVYGTGIIKTWWDETYFDAMLVGSPDALQCHQCGMLLSSPKVENELLQEGMSTQGATLGEDGSFTLENCPVCGSEESTSEEVLAPPTGPVPLQPYMVGEDEAEGEDGFGRALGQTVPKGFPRIEIVSPFDIYVENSGVDITPENCRVWGQCTPRSLDWIEERFPEKFAEDTIKPEDPNEIMRSHPLLGDWDLVGRYSAVYDTNIYDNHARVYEIYCDKTYKFPKGRAIIICADQILYNGVLYRDIEVEGSKKEVKLVKYSSTRYKVRPREFFGRGLVDDLISPQNRLNGMDSQIIEARERLGSPNIMVTEAMDLQGPEWNERGGGAVWRYNIDPLGPGAKPDYFGDKLFDTAVYQERDRIKADIKELAGPQDIEIGAAPKNITTTSGLQLLGEAAERRRGEREDSMTHMYESSWEHLLELECVLRAEDSSYQTETDGGSWEEKQFNRELLMGQSRVKIEKQAEVDKSLYQREATREAQADQLYRLDSQIAIKRILELRGLPTDVNEDLNFQVDLAKKRWVEFVDEGLIPSIDPSIDDFRIHFQALGTFLLGEEGQRIQKEAGWPQILKAIAGWEWELARNEAIDFQSRELYGTTNLDEAQTKYAEMFASYAQAKQAEESLNRVAAQSMMPAPPPSGLQPPIEPFFLPPAKEDRVLYIWMNKLQQGGLQVSPPQENFLKFRAVVDAYRLLADEKDQKAMMGLPQSSSPGTNPGNPGIGGATQDLIQPQPPEAANPQNPPTVK